MKKSLVLLLALVIFFCGTAYYAQGELLKEKDKVHYTENVLYGDKSIVEGAIVEANLSYDNHIFWKTLYQIGEKPREETEYQFYSWAHQDYKYIYSGSLGFQLYGKELMNKYYKDGMQETYEGLQIAMKELYDKTPNGAEGRATVYLKDYMDEYEFIHMLDLPYKSEDFGTSFKDYTTSYLDKAKLLADIEELEDTGRNDEELKELKQYLSDIDTFQKFFSIPVIEEEVHHLALAKDENGVVVGMGDYHHMGGSTTGNIEFTEELDVEGNDAFSFDVYSTFDNGDCYFTFNPYTMNGKLVDISRIPGGYGLYHFTYDSKKAEIDLSNLKMVYPLNTEELITEIRIDGSGKYILLFTTNETENVHILHVIDRDTMTLVDRFTLGDDERYITTWTYEDYIVVATDKLTVLELDENRRYVQAFSVDQDTMAERVEVSSKYMVDFLGWNTVFDWNGETLILANRLSIEIDKEHFYHNDTCDFYVAAVSEKGLLYYGEYYCSLLYINDGYKNPRFDTDMIDALKIRW